MATHLSDRMFTPGGCLTFHAIHAYLEGSASLSVKARIEEHLRHCQMCSEALEGIKSQQGKSFVQRDLDYISKSFRNKYSRQHKGSYSRFPILIALAVTVALLLLVAVFYVLWKLYGM
jgi:predicted anti-sigma-YlaC factor YlaD